MLSVRRVLKIATWPDPLLQERLEEVGFFFDNKSKTWIRYCEEGELADLQTWLQRRGLKHKVAEAVGRGELKRMPRLSEQLVIKNGGSPTRCALCGAQGVACRQWVEGDDTDSVDYPNAARFYMCGQCVQFQMQPHQRLYAPVEEVL